MPERGNKIRDNYFLVTPEDTKSQAWSLTDVDKSLSIENENAWISQQLLDFFTK